MYRFIRVAGVAIMITAAVAGGSPAKDVEIVVPRSYGDTCARVGSWCHPVPGAIPRTLRRPLHLPQMQPGGRCPTSSGRALDNGQFRGIALGKGPVRPLIAGPQGRITHGVIPFAKNGTWWRIKTLWFAEPGYRGPVFIRGRRLLDDKPIVFGEVPTLIDPQLPPTQTLNGTGGWRQWPGSTFLRTLGCYAWQIDGTDFSHVIVFRSL